MNPQTNVAHYQASRSVVAEELDGETILLSMDSGVYFGLNIIGTAIWRRLTTGGDVESVIAELTSRYQDIPSSTIARDAHVLVAELTKHGLLTPLPTSA
jgi:Coenzyme PQQ synthesis protein D (PqqD)